MALRKEKTSNQVFSIRECIDYYINDADLGDYNSIMDSSLGLEALTNNPQFMREVLLKSIEGNGKLLKDIFYSSQSFVLGSGENKRSKKSFTIRGVIWPVQQSKEHIAQVFDTVFSYNHTHDHNFDFLTIGYYGSGYDTTIYEYDETEVQGAVGEKVNLKLLENTSLKPRDILLFRGSKDIHTQLYPQSLSISINLLINDPKNDRPFQYFFNTDSNTISDIIHSGASTEATLLSLLGDIGTANSIEVLKNKLDVKHDWRLRLKACDSLCKLDPANKNKYLKQIKDIQTKV